MAACGANPNLTPSDVLRVKQSFYPSQHLLISCGCVAVDPAARKVAVLRDAARGITQLPKGRKNVGEDLLAAALREAYEETGLRFEALPLRIATRATLSPEQRSRLGTGEEGKQEEEEEDQGVTDAVLSCEPSSVCVHPCIYTGAFKIIFWFAARGDSAQAPAEGTKEKWEEDSVLEWVGAGEAAAIMSIDSQGQAIDKVLADMRNSGYDI